MAQTTLFPPIIRETFVPAFIYNTSCRIYFSLSQFNTTSDIKQNYVQVTVQQQKTNKNVLSTSSYPSGVKLTSYSTDNQRTTDDKYYITISSADIQDGFKLNQYYKIQIRFTGTGAGNVSDQSQGINTWLNNNLQYFSQWSTVALIYGIDEPTVTLKNLTASTTTTWTKRNAIISGRVTFSDKETLKSYRVLLYNSNETTLLEDSGELVPANRNQIYYTLKYNTLNSTTYRIKVTIVTSHLYQSTTWYNFTLNITEGVFNITYTIEPIDTTGSIKISITPGTSSNNLTTGNTLTIRRSSVQTDFNYWETVDILDITATLTKLIWEDFSVEPGILYKYQFIKNNGQSSQRTKTDTVARIVYPEDSFLDAEGKQLKLRFDPQMNNFNIKTSATTIETIGSPYPYVRRNGDLYYRTFSLSGTISHFMDIDRHLFATTESDTNETYKTFKTNNYITPFNDYIKEREFRDQVIKFLYSDSVKLFRSLTEGNILVKLTNVSLTPNNSLGRLIYSFSAEALEIDECSCENCIKYDTIIKNKIEIV